MLKVEDVSISFGGLQAVAHVDMDVAPGEIAGLIGPNGAGKTSLFNIITGLYRADSGTVTMHGVPIHRLPPHRIARHGIARTFQNIRLFGEVSALENVMIGHHLQTKSGALAAVFRPPGQRTEDARAVARAMELLEFVGLTDAADVRADQLPYGRQRTLEIARALATEPRLLLLDEPAAGMNETESEELMALIRSVRDELHISVLLIEHDMQVVMNVCDRITVLNFGRRIAHGSPQAVRNDPAVIEAYLGADAAERGGP